MRARAAYIRSLGTTSILVAAAFLMLGVVGAVVGFHRWPDGAVGQTVPSVPLKPAPQRVVRVVREVRTSSVGVRLARAADRGRLTTAGLVKVAPVKSPQAIGYPVAVSPGDAAPTSGAPATQAPSSGQGSAPAPTDPVTPTPPPAPPTDPGQVQAFVTDLVGSVPQPPIPRPGPSGELTVQVLGLTVSPPARAR